MSIKLGFDAQLGACRSTSDSRSNERQLLSLVVELSMDAVGGHCIAELGDPKGTSVKPGETVVIKLDAGAGPVTVFTGAAYRSSSGVASVRVQALDALAGLGAMHLEAAYEAVTSDFIVKDMLGQSGVQAGEVSPGPELASYAVHAAPSVLAHLRHLASFAGADIYSDGAGTVNVAAPRSGAAEHRFTMGETVLMLDIGAAPPREDGAEVWGEGAAEAGAKPYVLTADLSGLKGEASFGADGSVRRNAAAKLAARSSDGAIRSGASAKDVAASRAGALAARRVAGSMAVVGAPAIQPGDLIGVSGLPKSHPAAGLLDALRVRGVRHVLDRRGGLRTRLEF